MAYRACNDFIFAVAAYQVASFLNVVVDICSSTESSHISRLPRSHNMAATQSTQAKSILETINSVARNSGDLIIEVAIRITTLDDVCAPTTCDVDALVLITRLQGGVGIIDEVQSIFVKKNDLESLACYPPSPL